MQSQMSFPVVGLGGSAGGLQALMTLFENMPPDCGMAFVVILHLSPHHESNAAQILQRSTAMPVMQVTSTVAIEVDHVYVIPPHSDLQMNGGQLQVSSAVRPVGSAVAIDLFFRTLAQVHGELAFCVVLSGTGSDGAMGLSAIKGEGGVTLAQEPEDAQWSDMPRAAVATGLVDIVLPVARIGQRLVELAENAHRVGRLLGRPDFAASDDDGPAMTGAQDGEGDLPGGGSAAMSAEAQSDPVLHEILEIVHARTRHDFRQYKLGTVMRRIRRRLQLNGLADLQGYLRFLETAPDEVQPLLQDLLISVTSFFRDSEAFSMLKETVVAHLLSGADADADRTEPLRLWVAGCATGEEAYTLAMLVQEQQDVMATSVPVQIFASDIDERAIQIARKGVYQSGIAADVSTERLGRFFTPEQDQYRISVALREQVLFAVHNLLRDPPFSRVHLVCCRNLMIYLDQSAQARTLETIHYALKPGGYLMLGNSESTVAAEDIFTCVDQKNRIFRALPGRPNALRPMHGSYGVPRVPSPAPASPPDFTPPSKPPPRDAAAKVHQDAIQHVARASVLIDEHHTVLHLSPTAGRFMTHMAGVPSADLVDNVDPSLRLELRTALFEAARTSVRVRVRAVMRATGDAPPQEMDILVHPLPLEDDGTARILVVFDDVVEAASEPAGVRGVADRTKAVSRPLLEHAHDEIERLKRVVQDTLARTAQASEELGSANEELQASNEELRSAGEELETSREELCSMNEELMTVNAELRTKVDERGQLNDDLQNFMASAEIATVFVDSRLCVKRFTPHASSLFHLIASDVGRPLPDITGIFDHAAVSADAKTVFRTLQPIERRVQASDGRHFLARSLPYRTADNRIDGAVLTFIDITQLQQAEERVRTSEERLRVVAASTHDYAILAMNGEGLVTAWNTGAERVFGYTEGEMMGRPLDAIFTLEDRALGAPANELRQARETGRCEDERWYRRKDGRIFYSSGVLMQLAGPAGAEFAKIARDITGSKRHALAQENRLLRAQQAHSQARSSNEAKDRFLAVMSHELKQPLNLITLHAELLAHVPEARSLPTVQRAASMIKRAVASQSRIIDDLLDLSRISTGKLRLDFADVALDDVIRTLAEAAAGDIERKGLVLAVCCETDVSCKCDRIRVEQIASNLLNNAVKFTPRGGQVTLGLTSDGRTARLTVTDTGAGIAQHELPRIFELFTQIDPQSDPGNSGLGIGLTLVRELVLAHGGSVEASSPGAGLGACFTVCLPLSRPQDPAVR